jgi:hypothetical protein
MFHDSTTRLPRVLKTLRGAARITEKNMKHALREVRDGQQHRALRERYSDRRRKYMSSNCERVADKRRLFP